MSDLALAATASFPKILSALNKAFGTSWHEWEPETILFEVKDPSPLLAEKIQALQAFRANPLYCMSLPEFLLWFTSLANNEPAEFETVAMPTCLELGWALYQAKLLCNQLSATWIDSTLSPGSEELGWAQAISKTIHYLLVEDGYQGDVSLFGPSALPAMGTVGSHTRAMQLYIEHMEKENG